jgi:hypothetical protein
MNLGRFCKAYASFLAFAMPFPEMAEVSYRFGITAENQRHQLLLVKNYIRIDDGIKFFNISWF